MRVEELFRERFAANPDVLTVAPGRVNLIGEHTDYNEGFVFPAAIDRHVRVAAKASEGQSQLISSDLGESPLVSINAAERVGDGAWYRYAAAVAWALSEKTGEAMPEIQALVDSNLSTGSGLSSSAAIELAFACVWNELADLGLSNQELALLCQKAENEYVGMNCGIMDQMASAMGREDHAMFLDTKSLEITYAQIPDEVAIVVCDTLTPRNLTNSAYNERRAQCEAACEALGVKSLRAVSVTELEEHWDKMPESVYRRAHHVVTENARCIGFVDALDKRNFLKVEMLMRASHESLRDNYEVSSPALDAMAEAAWEAPGCIGARMTGAGFGGAVVALVEESRLEAFVRSTYSRYGVKMNHEASFTSCKAVRGAHLVKRY